MSLQKRRESFARVAAHEKLVDPDYYPGIRMTSGIVKVKLANVESRLLVQQSLKGEDPHLVKVKNVDIIDYLAHLATRENPQWRGIGSPGIPRPTVTSSREPWTLAAVLQSHAWSFQTRDPAYSSRRAGCP